MNNENNNNDINDNTDNIRPPDPVINEQLLDNDYNYNYELINQTITQNIINTTNYDELNYDETNYDESIFNNELNKALELSKNDFKEVEKKGEIIEKDKIKTKSRRREKVPFSMSA